MRRPSAPESAPGPSAPGSSAAQERRHVAALFLVFASLGASAAVIPATLPAAMARAPEAATTVAGAVPALFAGVLVGVLLSMVIAVRPARVAVTGALVQAAALSALAVLGDPRALVALAGIVGVGFGLVEATATALVRDLDRAATARRLAALTGTVALVAAGLPVAVSFAPTELVAGAAAAAAAVIALAAALGLSVTAQRGSSGATPLAQAEGGAAPPRRPTIAAAAIALALAVGVESVLAGNSAVVPFLLLGVDPAQATVGTAAFWILLAGGRFATSTAMRLGATARSCLIAAVSIAVCALAIAAASLPAAPAAATAAMAVAVVAIGPVYSLVIGMTIDGARARWVVGALIAAGSAGGATMPLALLLAELHPDDAGMWVALAVAILVGGSMVALARRRRPPALSATPRPPAERRGAAGAVRRRPEPRDDAR